MTIASRIREAIGEWLEDAHSRAIVSGTLESIPFFGPILRNIFDLSTEPEDVKTKQIIDTLHSLLELSDTKLEYLTSELNNHKDEILRNQDYLKQLASFLPTMTAQLKGIEREMHDGNINVRLDISGLKLEIFKVNDGIISKVSEVQAEVSDIPERTKRILLRPQIISALHLGEASVTVGARDNYASQLYAKILGVQSLFENLELNDIQPLLNVLNAQYGKIVSESFLLGRQLTILMITSRKEFVAAEGQLRNLLLSRLALISGNEEIVKAVDKFLEEWQNGKFGDDPVPIFFASLLGLLRKEQIPANDPQLKFIMNAHNISKDKLNAENPGAKHRADVLLTLFKKLQEHGIDDPDVDIFVGVLSGDLDLLARAQKRGGDPTKTDGVIVSKYRDLLKKVASTELAMYDNAE